MAQLIIRSELPPPPELPKELHHAFAELCGRLQAGGAEILPVDAIVIARTVQAEASLERAREAAAKAPLVVNSPSNGESLHPLHRLVTTCEANLRSWLRLLPKSSGGRSIPLPHVSPSADAAGDAAGDAAAAAAGAAGEPSENLIRLKKLIAEFQAGQASAGAAAGGGVAGAADAPAADAPAAGVAVC